MVAQDTIGDSEPDAVPEDKKVAQKKKKGGKVHGGMPKRRLDKKARGGKTEGFHPGGEKGKLHREMGIPEDKKIPAKKLEKAAHSDNPEMKRDAIRAETMKKWKK